MANGAMGSNVEDIHTLDGGEAVHTCFFHADRASEALQKRENLTEACDKLADKIACA